MVASHVALLSPSHACRFELPMPSPHTESCRMCKEVDVQCQPEVENEGRDRRESSKETQEIKDINGEIGTASMVSMSRFSLGTVGGAGFNCGENSPRIWLGT